MPTRVTALVLAITCAFQAGCAGGPPRAAEFQGALGKVAVVAAAGEPEISFEGFARGKAEGAARVATATFATCLQPLGHGCSGGGAICGVAVLVVLGICTTATAVGGVVGAAAAPGADAVASAETTLLGALDRRSVQESLREQVDAALLAAGSSVAREGADTVLETTLTRVGTRRPGVFEPGRGGVGIDPPLLLYMEARARLVRISDSTTLSTTQYVYLGPRLRLADWSALGGTPLLSAMETGYELLASHIYDGVFRLYRFPDQETQWSAYLLPVYGLAPVSPTTRGSLTNDPVIGPILSWTAVPSLQPTLEWEAFPRKADLAVAPGEMTRVKDVRYELIIARERNLAPAEVVYRRSNLPGPAHAVETALEPDTRYFWTVRASFALDGRQRVTRWGATDFTAREEHTAPSHHSYRFRTPRAER